MQQVLESDRKIRAINPLKFSANSLRDIDFEAKSSQSSESTSLPDDIISYVTLQFEPSPSDANIIYYISGALARSCIRLLKCESCKDIITDESSESLEVGDKLSYSENVFLTKIDRGGLSHPSHHAVMIGVHCWKVYEDIKNNTTLRSTLYQHQNIVRFFSRLYSVLAMNIFTVVLLQKP